MIPRCELFFLRRSLHSCSLTIPTIVGVVQQFGCINCSWRFSYFLVLVTCIVWLINYQWKICFQFVNEMKKDLCTEDWCWMVQSYRFDCLWLECSTEASLAARKFHELSSFVAPHANLKCDAYIWAKQTYLDSGRCNPTVMGYYLGSTYSIGFFFSLLLSCVVL